MEQDQIQVCSALYVHAFGILFGINSLFSLFVFTNYFAGLQKFRQSHKDFSGKSPNVATTPGVPPPTLIDHESIDDDLDIRAMIANEAIARVQGLASQ